MPVKIAKFSRWVLKTRVRRGAAIMKTIEMIAMTTTISMSVNPPFSGALFFREFENSVLITDDYFFVSPSSQLFMSALKPSPPSLPSAP